MGLDGSTRRILELFFPALLAAINTGKGRVQLPAKNRLREGLFSLPRRVGPRLGAERAIRTKTHFLELQLERR